MGAFKLFSSSSNDNKSWLEDYTGRRGLDDKYKKREEVIDQLLKDKVIYTPSPLKENYEILRTEQIENYLIVLIQYKDVDNYEGKKILLYDNCSIEDLIKQELIDPHFAENKEMYSPIARFEPTNKGWDIAIKLCKSYRN